MDENCILMGRKSEGSRVLRNCWTNLDLPDDRGPTIRTGTLWFTYKLVRSRLFTASLVGMKGFAWFVSRTPMKG